MIEQTRSWARRPSHRASLLSEISADQLSSVLSEACAQAREGGEALLPFASAGNLYGSEIYVCVNRVEGLRPGWVYHLRRAHGELEELWECDDLDAVFENQTFLSASSAVIIITARIDRYEARYGQRGYRFALMEAGAIGHLLERSAGEVGVGACIVGGFPDTQLNRILDLPNTELSLLCVAIGSDPDSSSSTSYGR